MWLVHGTTLRRAEAIVAHGPDPRYREPGGHAWNDGWSVYVLGGPYGFKPPEEYAVRKAALFPTEGGPALLEVFVPMAIIQAVDLELFPVRHGHFQFHVGNGMEELRAAWPRLRKRVRSLEAP